MNGLVRCLAKFGVIFGIGKAVEYFATRGTDPGSAEGKAAAKSGRKSANRGAKLINIMRRFSRF